MTINEKCWYKEVCNNSGDCNGCIKFLEMNYLIEHSGIPKLKQLPPVLHPSNNADKVMFKKLQKIKNSIPLVVGRGENIYIASSNTGNGKTSWAIKILLRYFDQIWAGNGLKVRGLFVHVPTLLLQLKNFNNPLSKEYLQQLKECDLIVWDDIASTELSGYDYSQLLAIFDYRSLAEKSNIFTSNIVDREELVKLVGARITSRIYNSKTHVFELTGEDER